MGYQESWVIVKPQFQFDKLIRIYEKQKIAGFYNDIFSTQPRSVVILKQKVGKIPAGTKVLWVCGERCFHDEQHIFGQCVSNKLFCKIEIIPIVNAFTADITLPREAGFKGLLEIILERDRLYTNGIDFKDAAAPNENAYMKRFSVDDYLIHMKTSKEKGR
jgi:hypothetical protein